MRCLWSLLLLGACVSAIRHVDEFSSQRERDYFEASGLGGAPSKYDSDSTLKQVWDEPGTFFSGVYSSHMVLQRAPEKAGLTGVVVGAKAGTTVTIDVTESSTGTSYTVSAATTIESSNSTVGKWTAYLKPAAAGGNYTITVACANCESPFNTSTIEDVTFGGEFCLLLDASRTIALLTSPHTSPHTHTPPRLHFLSFRRVFLQWAKQHVASRQL
jgi:hypothetical protein